VRVVQEFVGSATDSVRRMECCGLVGLVADQNRTNEVGQHVGQTIEQALKIAHGLGGINRRQVHLDSWNSRLEPRNPEELDLDADDRGQVGRRFVKATSEG